MQAAATEEAIGAYPPTSPDDSARKNLSSLYDVLDVDAMESPAISSRYQEDVPEASPTPIAPLPNDVSRYNAMGDVVQADHLQVEPSHAGSTWSQFMPGSSIAPSLAGDNFANVAALEARPWRPVEPGELRPGLNSGDVVVLLHEGMPYTIVQGPFIADRGMQYQYEPGSDELMRQSEFGETSYDPSCYVEIVTQGTFFGLRSPASGWRFLQPRRKSPHKLAFFNTLFGVWEQWEVENVPDHPWSMTVITLRSRKLPHVILNVEVARVGQYDTPEPPRTGFNTPRLSRTTNGHPGRALPHAAWEAAAEAQAAAMGGDFGLGLGGYGPEAVVGTLPAGELNTLLSGLQMGEDEHLRRISGLVLAEWFRFVDAEKTARLRVEGEVNDMVMALSTIKDDALTQIDSVREEMNGEIVTLYNLVKMREAQLAASKAARRRALTSAVGALWRRRGNEVERLVVSEWAAWALRRVEWRAVVARQRAKAAHRTLQAAFNAWVGAMAQAARLSALLARGLMASSRARQQAALHAWLGLVRSCARARALLVQMARRTESALVGSVFTGWWGVTVDAAQAGTRAVQMSARSQARLMSKVFVSWRQEAAAAKAGTHRGLYLAVRYERGLQQDALRGWCGVAQQASQQRGMAAALQARHQQRLQAAAVAAWAAATQYARLLSRKSEAFQARQSGRHASRVLAAWHAVALSQRWQEARVQSALAKHTRTIMSACLDALLGNATQQRVVKRAVAKRASTTRISVLRAWADVSVRCCEWRRALCAMASRWHRHQLHLALQQWLHLALARTKRRTDKVCALSGATRAACAVGLGAWWGPHAAASADAEWEGSLAEDLGGALGTLDVAHRTLTLSPGGLGMTGSVGGGSGGALGVEPASSGNKKTRKKHKKRAAAAAAAAAVAAALDAAAGDSTSLTDPVAGTPDRSVAMSTEAGDAGPVPFMSPMGYGALPAAAIPMTPDSIGSNVGCPVCTPDPATRPAGTALTGAGQTQGTPGFIPETPPGGAAAGGLAMSSRAGDSVPASPMPALPVSGGSVGVVGGGTAELLPRALPVLMTRASPTQAAAVPVQGAYTTPRASGAALQPQLWVAQTPGPVGMAWLLRAALLAWRGVTQAITAENEVVQGHMARAARNCKARVWAVWQQQVAASVIMVGRAEALAARWARSKASAALLSWHALSRSTAQARSAASMLEAHHKARVREAAWDSWCMFVEGRRRQVAAATRAVLLMSNRRQHAAFKAWAQLTQASAAQASLAATLLQRVRMSQVLMSWACEAQREADERALGDRAMHRAQVWRTGNVQRCVLDALAQHAVYSKTTRARVARMIMRISTSCQRSAFAAWAAHAQEQAAVKRRVVRLIATHSSRTLSSCFAAWRNVCDNASIARATAEAGFAAGCEQLRDSCFSGWARVAAQRKAARALLQRAVHKWQRGTAAEVIWAWSDVTRSMAARRAAAADKAHSAHRSLLATALQAWAVVAVPNSDCSKPRADVWIGAGGMDQERVIEAARRRSTTRLLRACLGVWREWSAGKREVREWTQLAAMKLFNRRVGAALQQWALIVLVRRQHDHAVRQQLARGNLRCISTHFLHWRNMVEESRHRTELLKACVKRKAVAFQLFKAWYWSTLDGDVQETIRRMFHTTEASVSSPEPSHAAARSARTSLGDSASLLHHSRMGPGHPLSGGGAKPPPMGTPGTGGSRRLGVPDRPGFSSFSAWVVDGRPDPTEPLYPPVMPAVGSSTPPAAHRSSYQYQHFGGMPAPMLASYPGPLSQAGGSPYGVTTSDVFTCVPNSAGGAAVARSTTTWATNPLGAALPAATSPSPVPSWRNAADNTVFVMNLNPVFLDGEPGAANGVASVAAEAHRPASVAGEAVAPHARMRPGRSTAGASTPGMGRMSRYGPGTSLYSDGDDSDEEGGRAGAWSVRSVPLRGLGAARATHMANLHGQAAAAVLAASTASAHAPQGMRQSLGSTALKGALGGSEGEEGGW